MKNKNVLYNVLIGALLIAVIVLSRLFVHTPNFTPVAAVALFAGFYFASRKWGILIAGIGMVVADSFIGFYDIKIMAAVYISLILAVFIGSVKISTKAPRWLSFILGTGAKALAASVLFFVISNLAVWLFSGMYLLNFAGLLECYSLALPFFKFTVMGDMLFSFIIFGAYEFIVLFESKSANSMKELLAVSKS